MRITFDKKRHLYYDQETGIRIPGSTEVLKAASLIDRMPENPTYKSSGDFLHEAIELALKDELVWESVDPPDHGFITAALHARDELKIEIAGTETLVWNDQWMVATKVDAHGTRHGVPVAVNWKTSRDSTNKRGYPHYKWQSAIECICADDRLGNVHTGIGIQLYRDGTFHPIFHDPFIDRPVVKAAITVYWAGRRVYGDRHLKELERNAHEVQG